MFHNYSHILTIFKLFNRINVNIFAMNGFMLIQNCLHKCILEIVNMHGYILNNKQDNVFQSVDILFHLHMNEKYASH